MNSFAQNILYIYLFVFLAMTIFDIVCIFFRKANEKRLEKIEQKLQDLLAKEDLKHLSPKYLKYLTRKLKSTGYLIAFSNVLKKMNAKDYKIYLKQLKEVFSKIIKFYKKGDLIKQTYLVSILANCPFVYNDNDNSIIKYLIHSTISPSVFLREYALLSLYLVGNEEYVKEALEKMNFFNINHHPKLLTDGFMKFNGNEKSFNLMLENLIPSLNANYAVACINYFNYKEVACEKYVYNLLTTSKEKEIVLSCIRYFGRVKYPLAKKVLYDYLLEDKNNWEYSALSATALKNYPSEKTLEYLLISVRSHNWYVRNNSASTIIKISSPKRLEKILQIEDKYAIDALNYQLNIKKGD